MPVVLGQADLFEADVHALPGEIARHPSALGADFGAHACFGELEQHDVFQARTVFPSHVDFHPGKTVGEAAFFQQGQGIHLAQFAEHLVPQEMTARGDFRIDEQAKGREHDHGEDNRSGYLPKTDSAGFQRGDFPVGRHAAELEQHRSQDADGNDE